MYAEMRIRWIRKVEGQKDLTRRIRDRYRKRDLDKSWGA